jgi:hypothetical protein
VLPETAEETEVPEEELPTLNDSVLQPSLPAPKQTKFLVFEQCLFQLLKQCVSCGQDSCTPYYTLKGSMAIFRIQCGNSGCRHMRKWYTQPQHNQLPLGNLFMSASILFSGSSPAKVLTFLQHLNVPAVSVSSYFSHQRIYLIPVVLQAWEKQQEQLLQTLKDHKLVLGGDARCDSPGHSAKYGSYTLMDLDTNRILDFQLVQVYMIVIILNHSPILKKLKLQKYYGFCCLLVL